MLLPKKCTHMRHPVSAPLPLAAALICVFVATVGVTAKTPVFVPDPQGERVEKPMAEFGAVPEQTVFVDFAPLALGLAAGRFLTNLAEEDINDDNTKLGFFGFGIGVQYERRLHKKFSLMGRLDYMCMGLNGKFDWPERSSSERLAGTVYAASFEAHARLYPFGEAFFLGGMAGVGSAGGSAGYEYSDQHYPEEDNALKGALARGYFAFGPSLGYRRTFGKSGAFAYETSFGLRLIRLFGSTFMNATEFDYSGVRTSRYKEDDDWGPFESFIVPRLTAALGYNF